MSVGTATSRARTSRRGKKSRNQPGLHNRAKLIMSDAATCLLPRNMRIHHRQRPLDDRFENPVFPLSEGRERPSKGNNCNTVFFTLDLDQLSPLSPPLSHRDYTTTIVSSRGHEILHHSLHLRSWKGRAKWLLLWTTWKRIAEPINERRLVLRARAYLEARSRCPIHGFARNYCRNTHGVQVIYYPEHGQD